MFIREPVVAGSFYPDHPDVLRQEVERLIKLGDAPVPGDVVGLLAPHAGYVFSGAVAAYAYSTLIGQKFDTVIVISPSHREAFNYTSIMNEGAYKTPLGTIHVDTPLASNIAEFDNNSRAGEHGHRSNSHAGEHSLEVQLPFLQVALVDSFKLVPIMMGAQSAGSANSLGQAIAEAVRSSGKRVLLVASSDLSHFHPDEEARRLDSEVWKAVARYDSDLLWDVVLSGRAEACGVAPLASVMIASKRLGANKAIPLDYGTSGDVPFGESASVVGYLSAAFVQAEEA